MVVARVRLNRIDTDAYAQCFRAIFNQVSEDHPTFKVGQTLTGIIADWSDQQANGLAKVVGKSIADEILKGCQVTACIWLLSLTYIYNIQVHFIRSVQRVAKRLNPQNKTRRDAFSAIGKQILRAKSAEDVITLFQVLKGQHTICEVQHLLPGINLHNIKHGSNEWLGAASWVEWWLRKRHLRKCVT